MDQAKPPSVNFHLWQPCNMRCLFCFARFEDTKATLPKGHMPRDQALVVISRLAVVFDKITFAGGEPTLCPWLHELVETAKRGGATTMLVTNGSRLDSGYLARFEGHLDWVALSVDSAHAEVNARTGRAVDGRGMSGEQYVACAERVRAAGIRLKVNTVVTAKNFDEDMSSLLLQLRPERWKILQVLRIEGQNDRTIEPLLVSRERFIQFVERHRGVELPGLNLQPEDNEDMTGSYAMVDPAGRFFDNTGGRHHYSDPILTVGLEAAWKQVRFSAGRFRERGGNYDWRMS